MAKLDFLSTGYSIIDETLTRTSSTALRIGHDLILGTGFEIWTGANKTGTKLTLTTDYALTAEIAKYTTEVGSPVYSKVAIVNGAYLNMTLYITYTTVGDMGSVANVKETAWPIYKTAAQWASDNTVLEKGQTGVESEDRKEKRGDGVTAWNSLNYSLAPLSSPPSAGKIATWSHGANTGLIITVYGSSSSGTCTYASRGGAFNVVGNLCFIRLHAYWTGHTGSGDLLVGGLPFNSNADGAYQKMNVTCTGLTMPGIDILAQVVNGQMHMTIGSNVSGGSLAAVQLPAAGGIEITGFYVF